MMEEAVTEKEFVVFYQPQMDLNTEEVVGAEALVRWFPKEGPPIYPSDFIPLFEANGFIKTLDTYVFANVCEFIATEKEKDHILKRIAVNMSGVTLLEEGIVEYCIREVRRWGIEPKGIEIEVTESAIAENADVMIQQLAKLHDHGFTISIDDFGTGVSSFSRLGEMKFDILKIDRSFLDGIFKSDRKLAIVKHILQMAQNLNVKTIAEGVETEEQRRFLRQCNCDWAQGYFYDKPMTKNELLVKYFKD